MAKKSSKTDTQVDKAVAGVSPSFAEDMKWKARNAMEDIARAEEHKKDKGLMKEVKKRVKETAKAVGC